MSEPTLLLFYDLRDLPGKLAARIMEAPSGCWEWCGARDGHGYGIVRRKGQSQQAHRLIYGLLVGPIPAGYVLDHLCRYKPCCNPVHLEPVTAIENIKRRHQATRLGLVTPKPQRTPVDILDLPGEMWIPIPGHVGLYEGSSEGRVRSLPRATTRGRILKQTAQPNAYLSVVLSRNGVPKTRLVHHLIAEAFLGPRPPGMDVRHLDGDRTKNKASNLAYGTKSENQQDSIRHGTNYWLARTCCANGHPYTDDNVYKSDRGRRCKACVAAWGAAAYRKRRSVA